MTIVTDLSFIMRKAIKIFCLSCFLFGLVIIFLLIDLSPTLEAESHKQVQSAESVQELIEGLRQSLHNRYDAQTLRVDAKQTDSLAGFVQRAVGKTDATVEFGEPLVKLVASHQVDLMVGTFYLNLEIEVEEGPGFKLNSVKVGDLTIPGKVALPIAEYLANTYTSSNVASTALSTIRSIDVEPSAIAIELAPIDGLLRELKNMETGGDREDTRILKIRVAHYLRFLDTVYLPPTSDASLAFYMQALFEEASILSQQSSATLENEAAILALAIYAGHRRFARFVGDLSFAIENIPQIENKPVLFSRQDLSLHFIYSAAIKLLSQEEISIAVGEFKELMDRAQGGSGYSFIDLAADMSGAHFAELAVDPQYALHLQAILKSAADERLFMVSIDNLEEGLSKQEFTNKYSEVDSPKYKYVINKIENDLQALAISRRPQ